MLTTSLNYSPAAPMVEGPAFSWFFKLLGCAMALGCALWFAWLLQTGKLVIGSRAGWAYLLGAQAILVWTVWHICTSVSRITAAAIAQSWIWRKEVAIADLAYAKFIRVRGLEWLVAPRLYVRTVLGKFSIVYVATPTLWAECERLVRAVEGMRAATLGRG